MLPYNLEGTGRGSDTQFLPKIKSEVFKKETPV